MKIDVVRLMVENLTHLEKSSPDQGTHAQIVRAIRDVVVHFDERLKSLELSAPPATVPIANQPHQ